MQGYMEAVAPQVRQLHSKIPQPESLVVADARTQWSLLGMVVLGIQESHSSSWEKGVQRIIAAKLSDSRLKQEAEGKAGT